MVIPACDGKWTTYSFQYLPEEKGNLTALGRTTLTRWWNWTTGRGNSKSRAFDGTQ